MRANPGHGNHQEAVEIDEDFDHEAERERMTRECEEMFRLYRERLDRGVAKEIARMCLPQNVYSQAWESTFTQQDLTELYERNPIWASIERQVYGGTLADEPSG